MAKPPLNRRRCSGCAAYAPPPRTEIDGNCRRRAPTLNDGPHYFPPVHPDAWCLEWVDPNGGAA
jgi:hypothetical protein